MVCHMSDECDEYFERLSLDDLTQELRRLKNSSHQVISKKELKQQIVAARRILLRRSEELLRQMQGEALQYSEKSPNRQKLISVMFKIIESSGEFPSLGSVDQDYENSRRETQLWFPKHLAHAPQDNTIIDWYRKDLLTRLLCRIENSGRIKPLEQQDKIYQEALQETRIWFFKNFHKFGESDNIQNRGTMTLAGWFAHTLYTWKLPARRRKVNQQQQKLLKILIVLVLKLLIWQMFSQYHICSTASRFWLTLQAKFQLPRKLPEIPPIVVSIDGWINSDGDEFNPLDTGATDASSDASPWKPDDPLEHAERLERIEAIRDCVQKCNALSTMHVPGRPDVTCQTLMLLRLPDPNDSPPRWEECSWPELERKFNISQRQLRNCFNRHLTNTKHKHWLEQCFREKKLKE